MVVKVVQEKLVVQVEIGVKMVQIQQIQVMVVSLVMQSLNHLVLLSQGL